MAQRYLAQINLGLEALLKDELKALGARRIEVIEGGVEFECTRQTLYEALLWSRISNRIYWRMAEFTVPNRAAAYDKIVHFNWLGMIVPHAKIELNVQWDGSQKLVRGQGELETLVRTGIEKYFSDKKKTCTWFDHQQTNPQEKENQKLSSVDQIGLQGHVKTEEMIDQDKKTMILMVRLFQGKLFFSVDLCGELMHKRGWRQEDGPAPIRATLACAILKKLKLDQKSKDLLIDPMCGSGTFAIEAFAMKKGKLPRKWDFYTCQYLVGFDLPLWHSCQEKDPLINDLSQQELSILMADQSEKALALSQQHLMNAQIPAALIDPHQGKPQESHSVILVPSTVETLLNHSICQALIKQSFERIIIVANPPYGLRVEEKNAISALLQLMQALKKESKIKLKTLGFIYPSSQELTLNPLLQKSMKFKHGGLSVSLYELS